MLDKFVNNPGEWLKGKGPYSDVAISSRIRLARNINGFFFPVKLGLKSRQSVVNKISKAIKESKFSKQLFRFDMDKIDPLDRHFLLERHLVSLEFINNPRGRALFLSKDETVSIMANEEDHLRLQVIKSGFDLPLVWDIVNNIDEHLSEHLDFAFSSDIGFLTSCPTNVGTGMRASVMVHLPGLIMTKRINKVLNLIAKLSFTARGLFGEGTQALGNFFQISNQVTLGVSEQEIIDSLKNIIIQLREQELEARSDLLEKQRPAIEDKIWRSYGILKNARLIDSSETLQHLSLLRLGVDLGIIKGITRAMLDYLFIIIQPAHLQKLQGRNLDVKERDFIRAELLREKLGG